MSGDFEREWRGRSAGLAERPAYMRLNGVPAGPLAPGASGGFASTPAEKIAAANTIETELQPNTKTATEQADESTNIAVKGFEGWETAPGLKKVADTWDKQVAVLMGRLGSETAFTKAAEARFGCAKPVEAH
ncbi:hypothetical protein [Streptomyces sp. NPDC002209]|uniref:hypothetical protein n=1 Tax=Streptomyces sp. NPDC002209 TaxID=3364638 RepID=UPI003683B205